MIHSELHTDDYYDQKPALPVEPNRRYYKRSDYRNRIINFVMNFLFKPFKKKNHGRK